MTEPHADAHAPGQDGDVVLRITAGHYVRSGRPILVDLGWTVRAGERWVVLGPNGAGKTTLLAIASTYERLTSGASEVLGERYGTVDVRELRARIGFVSAAFAKAVPPALRAADLVVMGSDAKLQRWWQTYTPEQDARALALLELFGCGDLADVEFRHLSEGERQRVQVARAQMADPDLLLLDEPAAGLDVVGREQLVHSLHRLAVQERPRGIVLVTHHLEEVPPGFTHALLLRAGAVVAAGPVAETLTSASVSDCFGAPLHVDHMDGRFSVRWSRGMAQQQRK